MHINGTPHRTVRLKPGEPHVIQIIDQLKLPWAFELVELRSVDEVALAIKDMWVRGAGCIGATAGYGMWLAALEANQEPDFHSAFQRRAEQLKRTRPTAVNLAYAVDRHLRLLQEHPEPSDFLPRAQALAEEIAEEDVQACRLIGEHGLHLIRALHENKPAGEPVNILTHCNAGWLAFVDHGSATAPIYAAHAAGIPVHVWVDETRPRNQGARLTAWELAQEEVPHTVIADNTGGHLMQHGLVDLVITGADRVTGQGDVANKIGTYLKALAARDNEVPFYVALPSSTMDWSMGDGLKEIPIEQRNGDEVACMEGQTASGTLETVRLFPSASPAANYAFDVTPARLVSGLITEYGIFETSPQQLRHLRKKTEGG
ncbi:S-methyl-5-thioribose-1-phosphate isomerase [Verrucomicrobium sp. BvORR034]|uniref:S-methyl-5-thioribose-1-phosphate isomerase n=1 Tax=Verrucomicrobium sp. BvORR034 TaxID=1396418 RepID=UPI00067852B6|nr:S-methyl-5-thioribose-1-phosphate isomerase [Verrucomicrobium sp. BvORR034]